MRQEPQSTEATDAEYHSDMAASVVQDPTANVFTALDRCDRCRAQAYVSVAHSKWPQDLLFCAHHGRQYMPALMDLEGVWVHDESDRLLDEAAAYKTPTTENA